MIAPVSTALSGTELSQEILSDDSGSVGIMRVIALDDVVGTLSDM